MEEASALAQKVGIISKRMLGTCLLHTTVDDIY